MRPPFIGIEPMMTGSGFHSRDPGLLLIQGEARRHRFFAAVFSLHRASGCDRLIQNGRGGALA